MKDRIAFTPYPPVVMKERGISRSPTRTLNQMREGAGGLEKRRAVAPTAVRESAG